MTAVTVAALELKGLASAQHAVAEGDTSSDYGKESNWRDVVPAKAAGLTAQASAHSAAAPVGIKYRLFLHSTVTGPADCFPSVLHTHPPSCTPV